MIWKWSPAARINWSAESRSGTESPKRRPNDSLTNGSRRLGPDKRLIPTNLARAARARSLARTNPILMWKPHYDWALMGNWPQADAPEAPVPTRVNPQINTLIRQNSRVRLLEPLQANQQPRLLQ